MKVIGINGSPHAEGNTYTALAAAGRIFKMKNIDFEIFNIGLKPIRGCAVCDACGYNKNEKCIFEDDCVNEGIQKMKEADAILLGSPVHFAGIAGNMKSFCDRVFYVAGKNGGLFRRKVGASVVAVRRSGGLPTFDGLNHYMSYSEMLLVGGNYWHVIHGLKEGEAKQDAEGLQTMEVMARNMAWLLNLIESGKEKVYEPEVEKKVYTHFIR